MYLRIFLLSRIVLINGRCISANTISRKKSTASMNARREMLLIPAPLQVKVQLVNKETGEIKEHDLFMGDFPIMTDTGTFIINGAERVIVSQLVRSPGVYYKKGNGHFREGNLFRPAHSEPRCVDRTGNRCQRRCFRPYRP